MKVSLHISKSPVLGPSYNNMYELVSNYMHGDGDGETVNTIFFEGNQEGIDRLKLFLAAYEHICQDDDFEYLDDKATEFFKSIGIAEDEAEDLGAEFRDDFYEGDITCDGNAAAFVGIDLFYWNEFGVKFEVDYDIK